MIRLTEFERNKLIATQLYLFDFFKKYCLDNNLRYYLIGGTLLGAIRHKGYIPWDDDLDVAMPSDDYYRFIETFVNSDHVFLDCRERDDRTWQSFSKLMARGTIYNEFVKQNYQCNKGIFIDIFPILSIPARKSLKGLLRDIWIALLEGKCWPREFIRPMKPKHPFINFIRNCCSHMLLFWCSQRKATKMRNDYLRKHAFDKSDFVNIGDNLHSRTPRKVIDGETIVQFEGRDASSPASWDEYLTATYGNYMKKPPESERVPHHYVCEVKFDDSLLLVNGQDRQSHKCHDHSRKEAEINQNESNV